jgi:hypothetical protein
MQKSNDSRCKRAVRVFVRFGAIARATSRLAIRSGGRAHEAIPFSSLSSCSERVSAAAVTFSRRWATDDVPGMSKMFGERLSSHARATAIGLVLRRVAPHATDSRRVR